MYHIKHFDECRQNAKKNTLKKQMNKKYEKIKINGNVVTIVTPRKNKNVKRSDKK